MGVFKIGIDPDADKNGLAVIQVVGKKQTVVTTRSYNVPECVDFILLYAQNHTITVVIEAGWLNKGIHHVLKNKHTAGRIGVNVGQNHQTGKILVQFMEHHGINYKLYKPDSFKWLTNEFVERLTGYKERMNQERRDAIRAAWLM